jgi:sterol desaturase/sphingolipid hydroxylase (fatty acid hydroxylase superfamily)
MLAKAPKIFERGVSNSGRDQTMTIAFLPLAAQIWLIQMAAYHGFGLWFEWLDRAGVLSRFKTRPVDRKSYIELLPRVLVNQVALLLPAMLLAQWSGLAFVGPAQLSLAEMILGFAGLTISHDVVQYVGHRFVLHRPRLMRRLGHSLHHSTNGSRGISACYMSSADFFLEVVCPYLIPLALIGGGGSDMVFHALAVTAGAFGGLYEHSGYDFGRSLRARAGGGMEDVLRMVGKLISSEAHAAHHSRGNVSFSDGFGSSNLCDTIFRTRFDLAQ